MIITSEAEYRAAPGVSFSRLKEWELDPDAFWRSNVKGQAPEDEREPTAAMELGTAAHCYTLEGPESFAARFVVHPETYPGAKGESRWNRNAKICSAWEEKHEGDGITVVSPRDFALIQGMRRAIERNPTALDLLTGATTELGIHRTYPHLPFARKGRLDLINHRLGVIGDVKTIERLPDRVREREKRLYYRQLPYYQDLGEEEFTGEYRLAIIWLEKTGHRRCAVEWLTPELIAIGRGENNESLTRLAECYTTGQWETIPDSVEIGPSINLQLRSAPTEDFEKAEGA